MTKIKICGLKYLEDVECVNELVPDYVGLVFAESKRKVSLEQAIKMRELIRNDIKVVGVFLDQDKDVILSVAEKVGIDVIQLHGSEDMEYVKYIDSRSKAEVWKAISIKSEKDLEKIREYSECKLLIDGPKAGAGNCFDWGLVNGEINQDFILAGGLNCENVEQAMMQLNPFCVDVSSGVESEGIKNYIKMKEFIERVRQYDKRTIR